MRHLFIIALIFVSASAVASPPAIVPFTGYVTKDVNTIDLQLELVNPDNNEILWCQKTTDIAVAKRRFMVNIGLVGGTTAVCVATDYQDLVDAGHSDANIAAIFTLEAFTRGALQVRLKINGTRLPTPQALSSLPYAAVSQYAERAKEFTVEQNLSVTGTMSAGNAISIDGNTVIDDGGGWHRSYGDTGWYNDTYGGGWRMTDSTWIRSYGGKDVYVDRRVRADGGFYVNDLKINNIKIVSGSISNGQNITTKIPSGFSSGWTWQWLVSVRDCYPDRVNNNYEQAQNQFQAYISSNIVYVRARLYNFKPGQAGWSAWRNCTANYLGIGIK
jgi:hypothetical protein